MTSLLGPIGVYMLHQTRSSLVQTMACRLFDAMPLPNGLLSVGTYFS